MKLDIDLNKLGLDELEVVIKLAKKQKEETSKEMDRLIEEETEITPIKKIKEASVEKKYKRKRTRGRKGINEDRALEVKKIILEKGVISRKYIEKNYVTGNSLWRIQRRLEKMHGISFAKIGHSLYYFRKGYDIHKLRDGQKVTIKGKKHFNKKSGMWAFKSKRLKELMHKMPHSTLEQKSAIMKQVGEEWRAVKQGLKKEVVEEKGFDYSKILADNPKVIKEILDRQLKISKTVNYRDVSSIIPQPVWFYDTITQILKYGDEIVKDLGLKGKIVGVELGKIELR